MARYTHIRNNFLLGEVSPTFRGRTDAQSYNSACEKIKNCLVRSSGGAYKRRGTRVLAPVLGDSNIQGDVDGIGDIKLIPFKQFLVIVTANYLKYINLDDTSLSYNPAAVNQQGEFGPGYGSTNVKLDPQNIQYAAYNDFLILVDGQNSPFVIFQNASGGLLYSNWDYAEIAKDAAGNFTTLTKQEHRRFPYDIENTSATTITASGTTFDSTVTLTASTSIFKSSMIRGSNGKTGVMVRLRNGSSVGVAEITAYTSGTVVSAKVRVALPDTSAHTTWAFSLFNVYNGFPTGVCFFQERLYFCGSSNGAAGGVFKDYIWGSQLGDIYEFSRPDPTVTIVNTDAFSVRGTPGTSSAAIWLMPMNQRMFVGFENQLTYLKEIDPATVLGATNTSVKIANSVGSYFIQPVVVDNAITYVDFAGRIREVVYNLQEDTFQSIDLSTYTEDFPILRALKDYGLTYVKDVAFQSLCASQGLKSLFMQDSVGSVFSCTRSRALELLAWEHHRFGGSFSSGEVQSLDMCVVGNANTLVFGEQLAVAVLRTINDVDYVSIELIDCISNIRTIELFDPDYTQTQSGESAAASSNPLAWPIFMDMCMFGAPFPTNMGGTQFDVGSAFQGETMSVIGDGNYLGEFVIDSSGFIPSTVNPDDYETLMVGYKFDAEIVPIALESNALFGSGIAQIKRTEELAVLFSRTASAEVGELEFEDDLEEIQFRENSVPAGDPIPLFTGEKIVKFRSNYRTRQNIVIKSSKPLPMEVSAIVAKGLLYD